MDILDPRDIFNSILSRETKYLDNISLQNETQLWSIYTSYYDNMYYKHLYIVLSDFIV